MSAPRRIQLRRTKGWRKPEGAMVVARPSRWGNPYRLHATEIVVHEDGRDWWVPDLTGHAARQFVIDSFRDDLVSGRLRQDAGRKPLTVDDVRRKLAGRDLACWCPLIDSAGLRVPCHADVLLELANPSTTGA